MPITINNVNEFQAYNRSGAVSQYKNELTPDQENCRPSIRSEKQSRGMTLSEVSKKVAAEKIKAFNYIPSNH